MDGGWLTVRSGRRAAVGVVTELVDVHSTLSTGVVAGDVPCDGGGGRLLGLLEGDGTSDLRVASNERNCSRPTSSAGGTLEGAHRGVFASSAEKTCSAPPPLAGKLGAAGYEWQQAAVAGVRLTCLDHVGFGGVYMDRTGWCRRYNGVVRVR